MKKQLFALVLVMVVVLPGQAYAFQPAEAINLDWRGNFGVGTYMSRVTRLNLDLMVGHSNAYVFGFLHYTRNGQNFTRMFSGAGAIFGNELRFNLTNGFHPCKLTIDMNNLNARLRFYDEDHVYRGQGTLFLYWFRD